MRKRRHKDIAWGTESQRGKKIKFHPHPGGRSKEENKSSAGKSRTSYVSVTCACNSQARE